MAHLPAAAALREALRVSPDNVALLVLYGEACLAEFNPDEAAQVFQRAVQLAPTHLEALLGLARALQQCGRTSEAILRVESLLKDQPRAGSAWLLLSRLILAEGQVARARDC